MISYGQPLKNITFGYSPLLDDDGFESMALGDLNYINGSIKVKGRMPINNELAVISKNDFALDDFSSIIGRQD